MVESKQEQPILLVLQHGHKSGPEDWLYFEEVAKAKSDRIHVLRGASSANDTNDGVEVLG
jgi:hypothetical protein